MKRPQNLLPCLALLAALLAGCHSHPPARVTSGANAKLFLAVARGSESDVDAALQAGADINARHQGMFSAATLQGATALYLAVFEGNRDLVIHLLDKGANANLANADGKTPGTLAQEEELDEIAPLFWKQKHKMTEE